MDNIVSQPLGTESFSYRWLATEQPSSKTEENTPSLLKAEATTQNFDFDVSTTTMANHSLVHADKLFFNGLIKPQYLDKDDTSKRDYNHGSPLSTSSTMPSPLFDYNSEVNYSSEEFQGIYPRKCWSKLISMRIVSKYLSCLIPVKGNRERIRVDDLTRRTMEVKSNSSPENASPRVRVRRQSCAWSDHSDESSIHEAILYCKQSSGLCP